MGTKGNRQDADWTRLDWSKLGAQQNRMLSYKWSLPPISILAQIVATALESQNE